METFICKGRVQYVVTQYLLYGVWHVCVYKPEEQVSKGPTLSPQHDGTSAPSMGQRQVDGQQLHAQQKKLMVIPE